MWFIPGSAALDASEPNFREGLRTGVAFLWKPGQDSTDRVTNSNDHVIHSGPGVTCKPLIPVLLS